MMRAGSRRPHARSSRAVVSGTPGRAHDVLNLDAAGGDP